MLYTDYTEKLLGLKDVIVNDIVRTNNEIKIYIQLKRKPHHCPVCNNLTDKIHDYRIQPIKDIPYQALKTYLILKKRRYVCEFCGKKFNESTVFLPRYHRMSLRLVSYVIERLANTSSMTGIAKESNLSVPTVCRIFNYINYSIKSLPRVLSIDEFKGNAGAKYQCILTDPDNKKVLDILKTRELNALSDYFKKFRNRQEVKYFVMDMWKPYRDIAETYFKKAEIIIDKFHYIRHVIWAFERVRKAEQKKFNKDRRLYFKRSKKLLIKRMKDLTDTGKEAVEIMLQTSPKLRDAYLLKEKFYEFIDSQSIEEAKEKLAAWYLYIGVCKIPEFNECFKTICNWEKYILNSFKCPYTNGFTEGVNNKIKVLKRNAYGVRNFERFRTRILHVMA